MKSAGSAFIRMDSRDFIHTPLWFAKQLLACLKPFGIETPEGTGDWSPFEAADYCVGKLADLAVERRVVLAIDTYEDLSGMDSWLREHFLGRLIGNVLVIIAGRVPLRGAWMASPAWRHRIRRIPLEPFDFGMLRQYLVKCGIEEENTIQDMWRFTRGHPLTLSLAVSSIHANLHSRIETIDKTEVLNELIALWLREVTDESLQKLLEAASILRFFNQELLSEITEQPVAMADFVRLTGLSFVRTVERGWVLHDVMRESIRQNLRLRTPESYDRLSRGCVAYYYRKWHLHAYAQNESRERSEFFYHLGDSLIRAVFFQSVHPSSNYLEPLDNHNIDDVESYFRDRVAASRDKKVSFVDHDTEKQYELIVTADQDRKESDLLDPRSLLKLRPEATRILRDGDGTMIGLAVMIPIHAQSLDYLASQPVSRAYFGGLSPARKREYAVPEETQSGWFIRMVDALDPEDASARRDLLQYVFSHLMSGGILLASTPLAFYQKLLRRLGFEEVPKALHYDYGKDTPSPTFRIDLRGERLKDYLDRMVSSFGIKTDSERLAGLTVREKEIAMLLLGGKSNAEIASHLYLSEITIKKNLSRMFEKFGVKNRNQLMKRLLIGRS